MKSRDALSRLKRFDVEEKQRKVSEIEAMIGDFNQMATDLDRQIAIEQERAGIQRRDNLLASAADLEVKLASARETLAEAFDELKRIELLEERDAERIKIEQARADLSSVAGVPHRVAS
jgi:flagellar biosynthesis chaperone FliJ